MMYQVIQLYGDFEPWWFIEGWQEDIVQEWQYETLTEAKVVFRQKWEALQECLPVYHSRKDFLATFWDKREQHWCQECNEYLQRYHSLMLLKDGQVLNAAEFDSYYDQYNDHPKPLSDCYFYSKE